jgi:hypothetical protein
MFIDPASVIVPELRRSATEIHSAATDRKPKRQGVTINISPLRGDERSPGTNLPGPIAISLTKVSITL